MKRRGYEWTRESIAGECRTEANGCWKWLGPVTRTPDGNVSYGLTRFKGQTVGAHRVTYELFVGPIPEGLELDHLCRNRRCVNPEHLEPVTRRENVMRSPIAVTAINARKTHCDHGHEFTPENICWQGTWRSCRTCRVERARRYRAAKKAAA